MKEKRKEEKNVEKVERVTSSNKELTRSGEASLRKMVRVLENWL